MKVLMIARSTLYTSPGGDSTQIDMTAKYLRKLGVKVDIELSTASIVYENYNLIHFYNLIRPDDILHHINHYVPFVVSSIFVDYSEYEKKSRRGFFGWLSRNLLSSGQIEYLKSWARWIKNGDKINSVYYLFNGYNRSVKRVLNTTKLLLPNSNSEYHRIYSKFKINVPYRKIVNAIDPIIFDDKFPADEAFQDHVLCVGRIEGRKNQLNLIKALLTTDIHLTIIGKPSPNHLDYYEECRKLALPATNIHFIEHISHVKLVSIYKAAKVHVLPSWFETTGLSSLEAGVMGCNIVVTRKGDTEEYFEDMAYYCEPDDIDSIRTAVIAAYKAPVNKILRNYILSHYTWEHTAHQTLDAYNAVVTN